MAAAVHTILEDLNEKDAEASTRQEKKDGVRVKAEDTAETGARERVLFIGTQFSILYTVMYSPA